MNTHYAGIWIYLLGLILFWPDEAQAQDRYIYNVEHLTIQDGLPSNEINDLAEDSLGFIWVATQFGLARFDGYVFSQMPIVRADSVKAQVLIMGALSLDDSGGIWVGIGGRGSGPSVYRYTAGNEKFEAFEIRSQYSTEAFFRPVASIIPSGNNLEGVWVGMFDWNNEQGGVGHIDGATGETEFFPLHSLIDSDYDPNLLNSICEDGTGGVWIGTGHEVGLPYYAGGLHYFHPGDSALSPQSYLPTPEHPGDHISNVINDVIADPDNPSLFWAGGGIGLHRVQQKEEGPQFTRFLPNPREESDPSNKVLKSFIDQSGTFWVGTSRGLFIFDRTTGQFEPFEDLPSELAVGSFMQDSFGVLWVGTTAGLYKIRQKPHFFDVYQHDSLNPNSLSEGAITGVLEDEAGDLWVSIAQLGLNHVQKVRGRLAVREYPYNAEKLAGWNGGMIYQFEEGELWGGNCERNLVGITIPEVTIFASYNHSASHSESIGRGCINPPIFDHDGAAWIPIWGGGFDRWDREQGTFQNFTMESHPLFDNRVVRLYEAPSQPGILWIATSGGLGSFEVETEVFSNYPDLYGIEIMMIHEDAKGRLWLATAGMGLILFDRDTGTSQEMYTTADGLSHNVIRAIYEDKLGRLWLSTAQGLSNFDPDTESFINYFVEDGLPGNEFREHAHDYGSSGTLYFGGSDGLIAFMPEEVTKERFAPRVVFSRLLIDNEPVDIGVGQPIEESIQISQHVQLPYRLNEFHIEYSAFHPGSSDELLYQYKLDGLDDAWVQAGKQRVVRYSSLDPGKYTFQVRAAGEDGLWSEARLMNVNVLPPWWQTWWAYGMYGLIFIGSMRIVYLTQRRRLIKAEREKTRERELVQARKIEQAYTQLKATQQQLIQQEKMASLGQLTSGIAHEIKNPLNFVNNFSVINKELLEELESELDSSSEEIKEILLVLKENEVRITQHGQRADRIVRSMMQHASGASGERRDVDLNALIDEYANLAYHGMRTKYSDFYVEIDCQFDEQAGTVNIVPQEIGQVLINLFNNAFYAIKERTGAGRRESGVVKVSTVRNGEFVEVYVSDNGIGIPVHIQEKIFEPFFTTKPSGRGTGLGLSLSYDIVTSGHGGQLEVHSEEGKGAKFVVRLPV